MQPYQYAKAWQHPDQIRRETRHQLAAYTFLALVVLCDVALIVAIVAEWRS